MKLDNKLREEVNQATTRLEEKNTELMNNLALSEKGIWEKIDLLTASLVERPPVQPERPPGLEPGQLLALEGGFQELSDHFNAVSLAQAAEITGTQAQVSAMGVSVSGLENTVRELIRRATLIEACPPAAGQGSGESSSVGHGGATAATVERDMRGNGWPLAGMAGLRPTTTSADAQQQRRPTYNNISTPPLGAGPGSEVRPAGRWALYDKKFILSGKGGYDPKSPQTWLQSTRDYLASER